ncbi:NADH-quinone oxidoreductase subunit NuoF [Candidatus Tachikawaea gelatinosa]|uniref:NADH-quinone oxidoreductase subunit NuoF n=1 Tax=Candidatus Tachikawaea gelatinosa TaxID=1410383 RepID=UPI000C7E291B|nr:NADH-quinone oxidoreductase subunit NuoF [Candidatus Tachikawaea gelatinosa]
MNNIIRNIETHPLTWRLRKDKKPVWFDEYTKKEGYSGFKKALKNFSSEEIIKLIIKSKLRGRGGAGFYTGLKWSLIPKKKKNTDIIYLLCNADEMEPGTYKDRLLMEQMPHQLIEGMMISAFAIQANIGYIFLRGEYIKAEQSLRRAIIEAKEQKLLGQNILNTTFDFEIFIHTGAGRYICGEETALINSLEGRRPNPRSKPPFPAEVGLWGKPTCVNNVETLSNIPAILNNGVQWYLNLSKKSNDTGTKMMGFCGKVNQPGVWELPFGITAREILENYANGMCKNHSLKAWQPGGAGTDFLLEKHLDIKMDFYSIASAGSRLGTGISIAIDNKTSIVSVVRNLEEFFARESCGLCTPCRDGLPWIVQILCSIEKSKGLSKDIKILKNLCYQLGPGKSFCAHAPGAIEPLQSALKFFPEEFEKGIIKFIEK